MCGIILEYRNVLLFVIRWHKYIDDLLVMYKNRLPQYGDAGNCLNYKMNVGEYVGLRVYILHLTHPPPQKKKKWRKRGI